MRYISIGGAAALTLFATRAEAANLAVITSPPTLLNVIICLVALAAVILCWQVASVVRGGLLSKSWQSFMAAFGLLAVSQGLSVAGTIELLQLPNFVVPAILVAMSGLFVYGIMWTKRTLS